MTHPGSKLRAVLFDLDGTLVDTADDFVPVVQQLRREQGLSPMQPEDIRRSVSNGARALVSLALSINDEHPEFECHRLRLLELYGTTLGRHARLYPTLDTLLARIERKGLGWGIATNKPSAYTWPLLKSLGLAVAPGTVICPDDVEHRKPHPESLLRLCEALDCDAAECIYVGDHSRDIEAGRRAGMFTIAAAYGYIEEGDAAECWGADSIAANSAELLSLVFNDTAAIPGE